MEGIGNRQVYLPANRPVDYGVDYHQDDLRNAMQQNRPRPASAHDYAHGGYTNPDFHDRNPGGNLMPSSRLPYGGDTGRLSGGPGGGYPLDPRSDLYGTMRGNIIESDRLDRLLKPEARSGLKSIPSNPGLANVLDQSNYPQRRSQSYELNLEKQGLFDYNTLLGAAGVNTNQLPGLYGNPATHLLDQSGQTIPTLSSLNALDFSSNNPAPSQQPVGLTTDVGLLQRECIRQQNELEVVREKLKACTSSIQTFWSPELKRERAMRKEENAKYAILADHLHNLQIEKQTMIETLHNMDIELRRERDLRHGGRFASSIGGGPSGDASPFTNELDTIKRQKDELVVENRQLKQSLEEAEHRHTSLRSSLTATEESLRRLIEAVKAGKQADQSATVPNTTTAGFDQQQSGTNQPPQLRLDRIESDRVEIGRLRNQLNEACTRGNAAEHQLIECNFEIAKLKEDFDVLLQDHKQLKQENDVIHNETRQTQTLQSLVDTKDSKILTLENEIRLLEDEITRLRDDGLITPNTSTSSGIDDVDKTVHALRSNERFLKSKVESLNGEVAKRDCEVYTLQSRLEMIDKQQQDQNHHISVLKEQVKTRDQKITMLTADTEDFRKRMKEKEVAIEKKSKSLTSLQSSKRQLESDLAELKDQLDIKERKISLLQRKIENLEDLLNDKDTQLAASTVRLTRLSSDRLNALGFDDTSGAGLVKDRLKESPGLANLADLAIDEPDQVRRVIGELRSRVDAGQRELDEKSVQLSEAREELRTIRHKHDSDLGQLQSQLTQRSSELTSLQLEKQMFEKQVTTESELKHSHRIAELEGQLNHYIESNSKLQTELDKLMRQLEAEKFDKQAKIHEVQEELQETQNNLTSLKRSQQAERKKQGQMVDEMRQREESAQSDNDLLKRIISDKEERLRELEQALRESVRITAEREIYASGRDDESRQLEQQLRDLRSSMEQLQRERNTLSAQLVSVQEELSDRESQLKTLEQECFQNYLPELERLRRSNHEVNLQLAAMIKLSQGREHCLTEQDRVALSGIPMFPDLSSGMGFAAHQRNRNRLTGSTGYLTSSSYLPHNHQQQPMSTSPHLTGSAFQLIGNQSNLSGRASVPGQLLSVQGPETSMLNRMLHERESMLQQNLQDLTHLRFQNSELEIRLKAAQRELDAKSTRLNALEANQMHQTDSAALTPNEQLTGLRKTVGGQYQPVNVRFVDPNSTTPMTTSDYQAFDRFQQQPRSGHPDFSELATLRRELVTSKAEHEHESVNLKGQVEKLKAEKTDLAGQLLEARSGLVETNNQMRLAVAEKDKEVMDRESLQKKYEVVLTQLSDKTDKLQKLEVDCYTMQADEIKHLKNELEDLKHHTAYLQHTIHERENRIEVVEKESFKLRDDLLNLRKQLTTAETELNSSREEANYKEERLRQLQTQHTEELARHRLNGQEQNTRVSQLEMKIEEKEHELKTKASELRCQSEELTRLQLNIDDLTSRLSMTQKRVDERESRLRKLEGDNHDLLDEIHGLRKGNTDLASQVDSLRQRLLDRREATTSVTDLPSSLIQQRSLTNQSFELDQLRARFDQLTTTHDRTQKALDECRLELDQVKLQREKLQGHLQLERETTVSVGGGSQANLSGLDVDRFGQRDPMTTSSQTVELELGLQQALHERDQLQLQLTDAMNRLDNVGAATVTYSAGASSQPLGSTDLLQQKLNEVTQTLHNVSLEADRFQRESKQASSRVQQLSRQLQETQNNCDAIARQRDLLQGQLDHLKRTTTSQRTTSLTGGGSTTMASLFGVGRPASVGPASHEGSASQLSRELDRLHRDHEAVVGQLQLASEQNDQLTGQVKELTGQLNEVKQNVASLESEKQEVQNQLIQQQQVNQAKASQESSQLNERIEWCQQQLAEKNKQLDSMSRQLAESRQYCQNLEGQLNEVAQRLKQADAEVQQQSGDLQHFQQLDRESQMLRDQLQAKENDIEQLTGQISQFTAECRQRDQTIQDLTRKLSGQMQSTSQADQRSEDQMAELQSQLAEASQIKTELERMVQSLQSDLADAREQLEAKDYMLDNLETKELQQRGEEIATLQRDLQAARVEIDALGGPLDPNDPSKAPPLKIEIDGLKRELSRRDSIASRMEKDCQEKHMRRIDSLQAHLHRLEEETSNMNKVLDEQHECLVERDQIIQQLKSVQNPNASIELEKLRAEHGKCKERIDQQARQVQTMAGQIEDQTDELLAIKLEALTSALCEKEANIALMEVTAPKNAASSQALDKLRTEKDQLQMQQRQLANTRAMLMEEKKAQRPG